MIRCADESDVPMVRLEYVPMKAMCQCAGESNVSMKAMCRRSNYENNFNCSSF